MIQIFKVLFIFLFCLAFNASAQTQTNGSTLGGTIDFSKYNQGVTFRNIPWGAGKEDVLNEDASARKETGKDYLRLNSNLGEYNTDITYFFWRNQLIKGTYKTSQNYGEFSKYMEIYSYFKDLLTRKHGKPYIDTVNWHDMSFKNQPERWLVAVIRGHLEYFAIWERDGIIISIRFDTVKNTPMVSIEYYISNIDNEIEKTDDTEVLQDL